MRTRARCERDAFTLVELLVVITIIVALVALTASAVLKFVEVQQTSNTQSTLDRVQSQLARAWSKVKDDAYFKSPMTEPAYIPGTIPPQLAGMTVKDWIAANLASNANNPNDPNVAERARVIYVKLRLRQAFPMNFNEALYPAPLPQLQGYVTYLTSLGITGSSTATAPIESSACLLMALQRGVSGAGINPSELTAGGAAGNYATNLGNLPYLADAWGRPIFFTRVPAGNLYLNPIVPQSYTNNIPTPWWNPPGQAICYSQPGANDPLDPQGYLQTGGWASFPNGQPTPQAQLFTQLTLQPLAGPNTSFKLAPMVASGGPNNWTKPGQILPFDPITFYAVPGGGALFSTP
jgi:prepilin-type N-terminal cleavage/methylation domain-containing protein